MGLHLEKSLCDGSQFSTLFLPRRFIKLRQHSISHNFLDMPRFKNSPELIEIEKVAETCELVCKEPLFVERVMGISKSVLG